MLVFGGVDSWIPVQSRNAWVYWSPNAGHVFFHMGVFTLSKAPGLVLLFQLLVSWLPNVGENNIPTSNKWDIWGQRCGQTNHIKVFSNSFLRCISPLFCEFLWYLRSFRLWYSRSCTTKNLKRPPYVTTLWWLTLTHKGYQMISICTHKPHMWWFCCFPSSFRVALAGY